MKKCIFIFLLVMVTFQLFAQAPDWAWASQAGGNDNDEGYAIVLDDNGNKYVTGWFEDTATFGSYSITSSGSDDIFVAKMDENGNWLWVTKAGGNGNDSGYGIVIDNAGNSYVTGRFWETATFGSYSLSSSGYWDIFVAKIDSNGNWLWVTKAGGNDPDESNAIAIDDNFNCYVTGYFLETATFGSYSLTSSGVCDIFIAKIDTNGNWLWAIKAGGSGGDYSYSIAIDHDENSYVTGTFWETATFGSYTLTSSGGLDFFVAKINANGNWLWATQAGAFSPNCDFTITVDDEGNSYVTGNFWSLAIFGPHSLYSSGEDDIFVAKMDTNGNWLWASKAGGSSSDRGYGITIDDNGRGYVTGLFSGTATFGSAISLTSSGSDDIFVAKLSAPGYWQWATKAGGSSSDRGYAITRDDNGNFYITGHFENTVTFGSTTLSGIGNEDIFVAKLGDYTSCGYEIISTKMELSNFPNPFNPSTTISFSLTTEISENTELVINNLKGQKIKDLSTSLCHPEFIEGRRGEQYSVVWNGKDDNNKPVSSGIYFYKLKTDNHEETKKMILLK